MIAAAEVDTTNADSLGVRGLGATRPCAVEVHVDEIGIVGWAMLGPRLTAYSGSPKPNWAAVSDRCSFGGSLMGDHGRIDQAQDAPLGVGVRLEKLRIQHQVCRHLDQARSENSTCSKSDVYSTR